MGKESTPTDEQIDNGNKAAHELLKWAAREGLTWQQLCGCLDWAQQVVAMASLQGGEVVPAPTEGA